MRKFIFRLLLIVWILFTSIHILEINTDLYAKETNIATIVTPPSKTDSARMPVLSCHTSMPDSFQQIIKEVIKDYQEKFKEPNYDTLLICDTIIQPNVFEIFFDDSTNIELEVYTGGLGTSKRIWFNTLTWTSWKYTVQRFKEILAHELFHTLREVRHTDLQSGLRFSGLSVILEDTKYPQIEEAAAQALAGILVKNGNNPGTAYIEITSLTLTFLKHQWLTPNDLVRATKTNDVKSIVGLLLNKNKNLVTTKDIFLILDCYKNVEDGSDIEMEIKKIADLRQHSIFF